MSGFASDVRVTLEEILKLREALRTRYPSAPHGFQEALEKLRVRAAALVGSADTDAHEAIELEFCTLLESAPEIREVQSLYDAITRGRHDKGPVEG